jgi:DNA-binding XRE family transcriptional regulator
MEAFRKKLEIRQQFLARKIDAATAELRILEAEAEQHDKALAPKIELARKESQSTAAKVRIGAASTMDQAEAAMRLEELEMERAKADLDLARVRQQLDQHRKGR